MGGGKSHLPLLLVILCAFFSACSRPAPICGVPAGGTPWQLAATIADHGDGSFVPVSVDIFGDKAYINGYLNTRAAAVSGTFEPIDDDLLPATICCDLHHGRITSATLFCETLDTIN